MGKEYFLNKEDYIKAIILLADNKYCWYTTGLYEVSERDIAIKGVKKQNILYIDFTKKVISKRLTTGGLQLRSCYDELKQDVEYNQTRF